MKGQILISRLRDRTESHVSVLILSGQFRCETFMQEFKDNVPVIPTLHPSFGGTLITTINTS